MKERSKALMAVIICIATALTNTVCSIGNAEKEDVVIPLELQETEGIQPAISNATQPLISNATRPAISKTVGKTNATEIDLDGELNMYNADYHPLSMLPLEIGTVSYGNVRRYLNEGKQPPYDLINIEEMINYFSYDLPEPEGEDPLSVTTELSKCPWNEDHYLAMIALQGKKVENDDLPKSNLVFLISVPWIKDRPQKLTMLKSSFRRLVEQLGENDRISIVVYDEAQGVVLDGARGNEKDRIMEALTLLELGGSTRDGKGLLLAYKLAEKYYIPGGNNRVVLATDGYLHVGLDEYDDIYVVTKEKSKEGISLSILGMCNEAETYKEEIQAIAQESGGSYAFFSNSFEAEMAILGVLGTEPAVIARDVELQVGFNPEKVERYRLVRYRTYREEIAEQGDGTGEKNDVSKDPVDILSGYSVIAFYEIRLAEERRDWLSYQLRDKEWLTISLSYDEPGSGVRKNVTKALSVQEITDSPSENFRFGAAVAEFAMILRRSQYVDTFSFNGVRDKAAGAIGNDPGGYRRNFLKLVDKADNVYR